MGKLMPWSTLYEMKEGLIQTMNHWVQRCHREPQLPGTNVLSNYASVTSGYCIVCCMDKDVSQYLDPFSELANSYSTQWFLLKYNITTSLCQV